MLDESFPLRTDGHGDLVEAVCGALSKRWNREPKGFTVQFLVNLAYKSPNDRGAKGDCVVCGHESVGFRVSLPRAAFHLVCAAFVLGTETKDESEEEEEENDDPNVSVN